ncbi:MAG: response regulator transcription factor [Deltaproteobacteria bacterium]|nr:response regulator transcription factor [Deltaproteobacteria bacterium]
MTVGEAQGRVLLIEDEELIGTLVELNLAQEGFDVEWHKLGEAARNKSFVEEFDVVLLDIMLPDADGVDLLRELRSMGVRTPVLMLTAKGDTDTKIRALDLGADDYLTKPFDVHELSARVRAIIRRAQGERHTASAERLPIGPYSVNLQTRMAETREGEVQLSEKETDLLEFFARHEGKTMPRADILEEVWGMEVYVSQRTIDNFIVRFRRLFEDDPENPHRFITVRGVGYRYER